MRPKYFKGYGEAPIYVSSIRGKRHGSGEIIFKGMGGEGLAVEYQTNSELLNKLRLLLAHSVPFSVGGHSPGPADEVDMLISQSELPESYIQISWASPNQWELREIGKGSAPWESTSDSSEIANISFDPELLK